MTASATGVSAVFASVIRGARLTTGDSLLEAAPPEPGEEAGDDPGRFTIPRIDCTVHPERATALARRLVVRGFALRGGTALQDEPQGTDAPEEETGEVSDEVSVE